jgi:Fe2+ transport system protein FeoA
MYLKDTQPGKAYEVINFVGQHALREKLSAMGLHVSMKFDVLQNSGSGPVEIKVYKTKLAIDRELCSIIKVEEYL